VRQSQLKWILIVAVGVGVSGAPDAAAGVPDATVSLGYPNSGRLVGGRQFRETPFMVMVPAHAASRVRWALPALLSVLDRASRIVARKFPGSVLELGELSRRDGGPIVSHLSHQNGRDADVGFYIVDLDGEPVRAPRFVRFDGSGAGRDDPTVHFDEKRNWAFVRAILEDPHDDVRQIFIYAPLRARLLAYAAKVGAPRELRTKAAAAMMQPVNALPHDDHFHIRISCPADQVDLGCTDLPLWHGPGSPDEFGPELLAEAPRVRSVGRSSELLPEGWFRMSKLWSSERAVCNKAELTCAEREDGPACDDPGKLRWPTPSLPPSSLPPPDEMGGQGHGGPIAEVETLELFCSAAVQRAPRCTAACVEGVPDPVLVAPPTLVALPIASNLHKPTSVGDPEQLALGSAPLDATLASYGIDPEQPVSVLYCAPNEELNACDRSMTALVEKQESGPSSQRLDRSIAQ